jgi:hypothetical protein
MLSGGKHTIKIEARDKEFLLESISLLPPENIEAYSEVSKNYGNYEKYNGEQIVIEAEKTLYKRKNTAVYTNFTETAVLFRFQRNIPFLAILHKKQQ